MRARGDNRIGQRRNGREGRFLSTMAWVLLQLIALISVTNSLPVNNTDKKLPSYLQVCHQSDPDINGCIRNSVNTLIRNIKAGSLELDLPPIDPLVVPVLEINHDSGNLSVHLTLKGTTMAGISQTNVLSVKANLADRKYEVASKSPFLEVQGLFSCEGAVLSFPLSASGLFYVNMTDVTAIWILYYREEMFKESRTSHFIIDDFGLDVIPSDIRFSFGNNLDGDNSLGGAMNEFLNGNSHEIFNDIKPRVTEILGNIFTDLANRVLTSYPTDTLLPQK